MTPGSLLTLQSTRARGLGRIALALRRPATRLPYLALMAGGAIIATGATWAVLQAVDGVTLKQAVDARVAASGTEEATRYADAETVRWIEWGLQSYFRVLLGVPALGAAAVVRASSRAGSVCSW